MDGSVLAVLAAYQNNLVTSKMMTSQVAEWFPTSTSGNTTLDGKELTKLTKLSKIVDHDKSTRLRLILVDLSGLMQKKNTFETKCPFL